MICTRNCKFRVAEVMMRLPGQYETKSPRIFIQRLSKSSRGGIPMAIGRTYDLLDAPDSNRDGTGYRATLHPENQMETKKAPGFSSRGFLNQVGVAGFEPTTSTSQMWRDTGLRYTPNYFYFVVAFHNYAGFVSATFPIAIGTRYRATLHPAFR